MKSRAQHGGPTVKPVNKWHARYLYRPGFFSIWTTEVVITRPDGKQLVGPKDSFKISDIHAGSIIKMNVVSKEAPTYVPGVRGVLTFKHITGINDGYVNVEDVYRYVDEKMNFFEFDSQTIGRKTSQATIIPIQAEAAYVHSVVKKEAGKQDVTDTETIHCKAVRIPNTKKYICSPQFLGIINLSHNNKSYVMFQAAEGTIKGARHWYSENVKCLKNISDPEKRRKRARQIQLPAEVMLLDLDYLHLQMELGMSELWDNSPRIFVMDEKDVLVQAEKPPVKTKKSKKTSKLAYEYDQKDGNLIKGRIVGSVKKEVEAEANKYVGQYPPAGYSTSFKKTVKVNGLWVAEFSRFTSCD